MESPVLLVSFQIIVIISCATFEKHRLFIICWGISRVIVFLEISRGITENTLSPAFSFYGQWLLANKDTHCPWGGPMLLGIALP